MGGVSSHRAASVFREVSWLPGLAALLASLLPHLPPGRLTVALQPSGAGPDRKAGALGPPRNELSSCSPSSAPSCPCSLRCGVHCTSHPPCSPLGAAEQELVRPSALVPCLTHAQSASPALPACHLRGSLSLCSPLTVCESHAWLLEPPFLPVSDLPCGLPAAGD